MARPIQFTHEQVLENAMHAFWENGYDGTSMSLLDRATGLNRGSIYNAFGGKKQLYLLTLECYGEQQFGMATDLINRAEMTTVAVRDLFGYVISTADSGNIQRGCLICNAAIECAPMDKVIAEVVQKYLNSLTMAFTNSLKKSADKNSVTSASDISHLAQHLTTTYMGLNVIAKSGLPVSSLRHVQKSTIKLLDQFLGSK